VQPISAFEIKFAFIPYLQKVFAKNFANPAPYFSLAFPPELHQYHLKYKPFLFH